MRPPSYALGLFLNLLLPGAGFSVLGRWGWHLGWAGLSVLAFFAALTLTALTQTPALLALTLLGTAAMLLHFHRLYRHEARRGFPAPLSLGAQLALILGQVLLGFFVIGIFAAILTPNLLAARKRSLEASELVAARSVQAAALARQATLRPGPCPPDLVPADARDLVTACTVVSAGGAEPQLSLTFQGGRTVSLP